MDQLSERPPGTSHAGTGWLLLIFSLYACLALGYSLLMPVWEAPDEPAHYHIAWFLARSGHYPTTKQNYEANQPRAFYYLGSWVIRALDRVDRGYSAYFLPHENKFNIRMPVHRFDWDAANYRFMPAVQILRWINVLFGAAGLWLSWKAFRLLTPAVPALRLAALALAALTPQFLHIMSSVNNDALGTLAGALLFYLALRLIKEPSVWLSLLSILLALVLPLTTKLTVLPVSAAVLIIIGWQAFGTLRPKRWLVFAGLAFLVAAGLLYLLTPGSIKSSASEIIWRLLTLRKAGLTPEYLKIITIQIGWTYWGQVGWLAVGPPAWVVAGLTLASCVGAALNIRWLAPQRGTLPQFRMWMATWLIALLTIAAVGRNGLTTGATQGRFLFPAIGALSVIAVGGWHLTLPEQFQRALPVIVVALMVSINLALWIWGILPAYYQPFLG
jgi:hypothetical protein